MTPADYGRSFADTELKPNAGLWDREHKFPADAVKEMAKMGLMGVAQDDKYGGAGMDAMSYAIAVEEISRGCASAGVIMSAQNSLYCEPVGKFGNEQQLKDWLTPCASGEKIGCFALSEPGNGSDAGAQSCTATLQGDHYILNGENSLQPYTLTMNPTRQPPDRLSAKP